LSELDRLGVQYDLNDCDLQEARPSQYLTVPYRGHHIEIRVSDHAQKPGGGYYIDEATGEGERLGESDLHYVHGDGKRVRDLKRHLDDTAARVNRQRETDAQRVAQLPENVARQQARQVAAWSALPVHVQGLPTLPEDWRWSVRSGRHGRRMLRAVHRTGYTTPERSDSEKDVAFAVRDVENHRG